MYHHHRQQQQLQGPQLEMAGVPLELRAQLLIPLSNITNKKTKTPADSAGVSTFTPSAPVSTVTNKRIVMASASSTLATQAASVVTPASGAGASTAIRTGTRLALLDTVTNNSLVTKTHALHVGDASR